MGVDKGVEIGVKGLENGDWTFIRSARFVDEGSTSGFERTRKEASGKDEGNEALNLLEPDGVKSGKKIEGESAVS